MAHDDPTGPADVLELETPASDAPAGLETAEYEAPSMPAAADDPTGETGVGIDDEAAEQQEAALSPARPVPRSPSRPSRSRCANATSPAGTAARLVASS